MGIAIQIRDVPAALHKRLKLRAVAAGRSLSEHLLVELGRLAALPTHEEMLERLRSRPAVRPGRSAAALVRRERVPG